MKNRAENISSPEYELPMFFGESPQARNGLELKSLRKTLELFFLTTGFSVGIMDHPSRKEIFSIGANEICTKFHRASPKSEKRCLESNILLTGKLKGAGEFKVHRCKNSLHYGAIPIMVGGTRVASIFFGQVLFKNPDISRFVKQAAVFGYDVEEYLNSVMAVQVVCKKRFMNSLSFLSKFSVIISASLMQTLEQNDDRKDFDRDIFKNIEMEERLKLFAAEVPRIKEQERRKIGSQLHDNIGQNLALMKLKLLEMMNSPACWKISENLKEIDRLTTESIESTRKMAFDLGNPLLYEVGLEPAVEWLIDRYRESYGLECRLIKGPGVIPMDTDTRVVLYQAVREMLVNILKHAGATLATVTITTGSKNVKIQIEDNGTGFCPSKKQSGMGLFCIRERLARIGGQFDVQSEPGKGSRFSLTVPVSTSGKKKRAVRKPKKAVGPRKPGPRKPGPKKLKIAAKPHRKKHRG
ncbi:MAG: PocR ligand-binding domain-containing protein [Pseudomonadota bacterium]